MTNNRGKTSGGKTLFQKKPLGRRWHLANSPKRAVRLVPLRQWTSSDSILRFRGQCIYGRRVEYQWILCCNRRYHYVWNGARARFRWNRVFLERTFRQPIPPIHHTIISLYLKSKRVSITPFLFKIFHTRFKYL